LNGTNSKLTRKQRRHFDRAFERIRGNCQFSYLKQKKKTSIESVRFSVHNTMVTSAIFAPNPSLIMDHLYSSNLSLSSDSSSISNRSQNSTTTSIGNSTHNRSRLICVHSISSPMDPSTTMNTSGPTYVMVTADSKGQLKLLVNRYHR